MISAPLNTLPAEIVGLFGLSVVFVTLVSVLMSQSHILGVMTGLGGVSEVVLTFYLVKPGLLSGE